MCDSTYRSKSEQDSPQPEAGSAEGSIPVSGPAEGSPNSRSSPGSARDGDPRLKGAGPGEGSEAGENSDSAGAGLPPEGGLRPPEVRFLVDSTAGKLVRWLRLLGFDSVYADQAADFRLVHRARSEGRILLTRRRSAAALPWAEAVLLESDCLDEQLVQVARMFPPSDSPLSRCSLCNGSLIGVPRDEVEGAVPPFVYRTASGFSKCSECEHVYWEGTHCSKITHRWKKLRDLSG